jgi:hypothetical protein
MIHSVIHELNMKIIMALLIAELHKLKLTFGGEMDKCLNCVHLMCS